MLPGMTATIVTTSWDDGHRLDLQLARRLAAHALKGTFYVALNVPGHREIGDQEIRALHAMGMEIGSHTLSHRLLTGRSKDEVRYELRESKARLEDIVGAPVTAFSYPEGAFAGVDGEVLGEAGYTLGRTTVAFRTAATFDPARMPISLEFRRASHLALARHALRDVNLAGLADWLRIARLETDPVRLGKTLFEAALARGGIFHLNARSWEIERNGLWMVLDELMSYIANRPGVWYVTNTAALECTPEASIRLRSSAFSCCLTASRSAAAAQRSEAPMQLR
jgi:peptidoglycan/xylan/chitin deacetylase (PgdA/CDA1 family)